MNIRKRLLAGFALGATVALAWQAQAAESVKIGVIDPVKTLIGKENIAGAELAAQMINEAGGILGGRQVELVIYDTAFSPRTA